MAETFDYIVVGAGSAGCVVANRLSERGACSVLLLESGPRDSSPWIHLPIGYAKNMFNPRVNWCFRTEAEENLGGRSLHYPAGKVLGGSSSINGLLYVRGQREDYDEWARRGNAGWRADEVLPFFKRSESQERGGDEWHGTGGPLAVSDARDTHPLCDAFIASAQAVGIPANGDFNGRQQEGVGYYQMTARRGRRVSSAVAFLRPAMKRANVRVEVEADVHRILLDGTAARGVVYRRAGSWHQADARRAVVLCAGALSSPVILQRSGIGPASILHRAGVDARHELPGVGANLQDHLQAKLVFRIKKPITLNDAVRSVGGCVGMGVRYVFARRGWLTVAAGQAGGFARSETALERPDVQFHVMALSTLDPAKGLDSFPGLTVSVCQLRPESRGSVEIASGDMDEPSRIRFGYLSSEHDRRTLLAGLRLARQIASQAPLREHISREERPGDTVSDDEGLLAYVRERGGSVFHPAGTCSMGRGEEAVVDERLRVHGLEGLYVADASVMPTLVSGNTNAASMMIGERAAAFIHDDLG